MHVENTTVHHVKNKIPWCTLKALAAKNGNPKENRKVLGEDAWSVARWARLSPDPSRDDVDATCRCTDDVLCVMYGTCCTGRQRVL